jgi:hypothetical protein
MQQDSVPVARGKRTRRRTLGRAYARSRVSNGTDVLPDVDGRSMIARRYRDIMSSVLVDQGGSDRCSEARKQLIRRFAAAAVLAEQLESRLANGDDIDNYATLSSTLIRLAQRIGVDRVQRDISPTDTFPLEQEVDDVAEVSDDQTTREARALAAYLRLIKGGNARI